MKARQFTTAGSLSQVGSVGSFRYAVEMMPLEYSRLAGLSTEATEVAVLARKNFGFQPSSPTLRIACAEPFGAAQEKKMSAPESCRNTICESIEGSLTSYDLSAMIMLALSPSPSFKPLN